MKILLDARTVGKEFSGVGNYVFELIRALGASDVDHDFHLLVYGDSRLRDVELDSRFHLHEAAFSHENHPLGDFWEHGLLPRRARRLGVDVLHGPAFLIPTFGAGCAQVVTVHDLVAFTHPETIPLKYAVYMRWLIRRAARAADRVITVSQSVRDDVVRLIGTDASRVDCIAHGVSERFRPSAPEAVRGLRERYGLRRPYLLFVGNLEPRKNLPGLVRAFRSLIAEGSEDLELVVAGQVAWLSGTLLPSLEAPDLAGRIRLLGFVPAADLPTLYTGAEAFVFPTFWEGFGLPILEAMACGTPVVTSAVAAIPEVAGEAAVLVDPSSADSIADGIRKVLETPQRREELRRRGVERALGFSWARTAATTLETYRRAAGERS